MAQMVTMQCRRPGFDPWVGKIPWRREGPPTPVFWPGEFHGLYSPWGHKELDTAEELSLSPLLSYVRFATRLPSAAITVGLGQLLPI